MAADRPDLVAGLVLIGPFVRNGMGDKDPDFPEPASEAGRIGRTLHAEVVMVPQAGHYPQSQQPELTTEAVLRFIRGLNREAADQETVR